MTSKGILVHQPPYLDFFHFLRLKKGLKWRLLKLKKNYAKECSEQDADHTGWTLPLLLPNLETIPSSSYSFPPMKLLWRRYLTLMKKKILGNISIITFLPQFAYNLLVSNICKWMENRLESVFLKISKFQVNHVNCENKQSLSNIKRVEIIIGTIVCRSSVFV